MGASEKDMIPMLSPTVVKSDASTRRVFSRMRSASMSIPPDTLESEEQVKDLVGFTGLSRNERKASFVHMSGPLFISRNHEVIFQPPKLALEPTNADTELERYPSTDEISDNGWRLDSYEGKHGNLLKSGQLGLCNDPYCTTCPTFYNGKGRMRHSRTSEIFDAKVLRLWISLP